MFQDPCVVGNLTAWTAPAQPLRRGSDRVEGWTRATATVIVCLVAPVIAALMATAVYHNGMRTEESQRAERHLTQAVLAQDAVYSSTGTGSLSTVLTLATWKGVDETEHTGWVRARIGTMAGAAVPIWIDAQGVPTAPPREHDQTLAAAAATAILVPICTALLLGLCCLVLRVILDRRRLCGWQAAWSQIEPQWSGRPA